MRLRGETGDILPSAIQIDRSGTRLVVSLAEGVVPDSLFLTGAVDTTAGLPVGGTLDLALPLPPSPAEATPVLADIKYFAGPLPRLIVHVRPAFIESCDAPFVLEPGGLLPRIFAHFLYPPGVILALDEPLARRNLHAQPRSRLPPRRGLPARAIPELPGGRDASSRNPLRLGEPLVLENVSPGSKVEILDVAGRVRASWRVAGDRDQRTLDDLAPGLYFIRLQEITAGNMTTRRLVVLR